MITTILNILSKQITNMSSQDGMGEGGAGLLGFFGDSIPTFYFQIVVGIYIIQITYLLTTMLNTIQNGYDPLSEKHLLGKYFSKSGMLYCFVAAAVILVFNIIASMVISGSIG